MLHRAQTAAPMQETCGCRYTNNFRKAPLHMRSFALLLTVASLAWSGNTLAAPPSKPVQIDGQVFVVT